MPHPIYKPTIDSHASIQLVTYNHPRRPTFCYMPLSDEKPSLDSTPALDDTFTNGKTSFDNMPIVSNTPTVGDMPSFGNTPASSTLAVDEYVSVQRKTHNK